jgi:uncharacterized SAM-binding protein YcdF (DUF218 family)
MQALGESLKTYLIPGSDSFLLLGLALGAALLYLGGPRARWGRGLLTGLATLYLILSLPLTARTLETALALDLSAASSEALVAAGSAQDGATAIVVLGGGTVSYSSGQATISELSDATSLRLLEAVRLEALLGEPWIIVSGGPPAGGLPPETEPMAQELLGAGIPEDRIRIDDVSGSTREQALNLGELIQETGAERFLLVTSPIHMRRALASFRAEGLDPLPAPSAQHSLGHPVTQGGWLPHPAALDASQSAIREALALGYYWARGWLRAP